jgi:hypothetical protein
MDNRPHNHESPKEQPAGPQRRGWHAPQFFVAELAATVTQLNGGFDGASAAPSQS